MDATKDMGVSQNRAIPPNHPLKNSVLNNFHHPFWCTPIFGNTHTPICGT